MVMDIKKGVNDDSGLEDEQGRSTPGPDEAEAAANRVSSDPVATYLKEIRSVPLLTRAEEVELAGKIEQDRVDIIRKLLGTSILIEELNSLKAGLMRRKKADEIIYYDYEENLLTENEQELKPIIDTIEEIKRIHGDSASIDGKWEEEEGRVVRLLLDIEKRTNICEKAMARLRDIGKEFQKLREEKAVIEESVGLSEEDILRTGRELNKGKPGPLNVKEGVFEEGLKEVRRINTLISGLAGKTGLSPSELEERAKALRKLRHPKYKKDL